MTWRKLRRKPAEPDQPTGRGGEPATSREVPPHLAQAIARRSPGDQSLVTQDPAQRKLAGLRRQRLAILFDIEQGELAAAEDNPWTQRIGLLNEALVAVAGDLIVASKIVPGPFAVLPQTPIAIGAISLGNAASVEFAIEGNRFLYSEDPDWAERGHQIARTELVQRSGDVNALVPDAVDQSLQNPLREHLHDSLFVLASDLRDRALDGDPLPESPTLVDLAAPCPICGGWTDWRGTCQSCARRNARLMELKREESRLLDERAREAEERHRLIEGIPLARKRLRDAEADLARAGEPPA